MKHNANHDPAESRGFLVVLDLNEGGCSHFGENTSKLSSLKTLLTKICRENPRPKAYLGIGGYFEQLTNDDDNAPIPLRALTRFEGCLTTPYREVLQNQQDQPDRDTPLIISDFARVWIKICYDENMIGAAFRASCYVGYVRELLADRKVMREKGQGRNTPQEQNLGELRSPERMIAATQEDFVDVQRSLQKMQGLIQQYNRENETRRIKVQEVSDELVESVFSNIDRYERTEISKTFVKLMSVSGSAAMYLDEADSGHPEKAVLSIDCIASGASKGVIRFRGRGGEVLHKLARWSRLKIVSVLELMDDLVKK